MRKNKFAKVVSVILIWLIVSSMLGAFPSVVSAATFNIGDTVEVTENLNVRTGPGTTYPEITDPDYIDYAPTGTPGTVLDGPTSANGYVWWRVDFGPGLYSGWSVEGGLQKIIQPTTISARIDSYSPSSRVDVTVGSSTQISVTFTNTGNTAWSFIAGATVWDSGGSQIANYSTTLSSALQPGQQTTVSWTHPVNQAGDYWLQFGIWKATPYTAENLLDKKPSPSQNLIRGLAAPQPTIDYSPSSFSFSATQGGSNPSSQTLDIRNSGGGTLSWSVSDDAGWLSLSPTSGTSTGETDSVAISVSISGMSTGSYSATITVSASGATNTPQTVPVSLTINQSTTISARIDSYSPSSRVEVTVGGSTTISVIFTNTGNTAWSFIAGATVWDSGGNQVANYSKTLSSALQPGQQTTVSWTHPVNQAGDYWLQFGIWKATPYTAENLLDKKPSPSQNLIRGIVSFFSDLAVTNIEVDPSPPTAGGSTTIGITIANQGGGDVTDTFFLEFYFDGTYQGHVYVDGLAAGSSRTSQWQAHTWPSDTNPHTVRGVVDPGNAISESNEGNNERSEQFTAEVNQLPTCSVTANPSSGDPPLNVTFSLSASDPGGSITAWVLDVDGDGNANYSGSGAPPSTKSHTYNNQGTYSVVLMVSDNDGANASDTETVNVGSANQPPTCSLSANPRSGSAPLTVTFSMSASDSDGSISSWVLDADGDGTTDYSGSGNPPSTQGHTYESPGDYTAVLMISDNDDATASDTETISVTQPSLPDLVVTDIQVDPSLPTAGGSTTIGITIANQGGGDVTDTFFLEFYFDGTYQGHVYVDGLAAGSSRTSQWQAHTWPSDTNPHTVRGVVDPDNAISESNEGNNERSEQFTAQVNQPDLVIVGITWSPVSPSIGETVTFTVTIKNQGNGKAGNSKVYYFIANVQQAYDYVSSLDPDTTMTETFAWEAQEGQHPVKVVIDYEGDVDESDETNNEKTINFSATALSDLVIEGITWSPASPSIGDTVTFTVTIKNQGSGKAGSYNVYYFIDDVQQGYDSVYSLDPNETATETFTWNAEEGSHSVKAVTDYNEEVAENDETNNEMAVTFSIGMEVVSTPSMPSGPTTGTSGISYSYLTEGASSSYGHNIEYQFDWGDGNYSAWSRTASATYSWPAKGVYTIRAQARCALHTSIVSDWSLGLSVSVTSPTGTIEITSEPSGASFTLNGPQDYSGTTPWRKENAPVGTYRVTWGFMSGYETPSQQSKALTQGEKASFFGHYTTSNIVVRLLSTDVSPSGSGSVSLDPSGDTYDQGAKVTLTASPVSGYIFDHWGGDASGTRSSVTITMDSDKSVTAYFTAVPPLIGVSPATLSFETFQSGVNPPTKTIAIWNAGGGTLDWEVSSEVTWVNFSKSSGSSTEETDKIALSVDITEMVAGDYSSTITISAIGPTNLSRIVPVSLSISPQPVASVLSDLTVTLVDAPSDGIVGQNISVTFVVENRGNDASGPFHSMVALSPKSKPWGTEMYLADITMDSIPPDKSKRVTVDVTVPPSLSSPSDYYVTVFADAFEKVLESNEGNNIGSTYPQTIAVTSETSTIADLITSIATGGVPVTVDGELYFILTLENHIDPLTLEVVPGSSTTKVYVDAQNYPVSDKKIVSKIGFIDFARQMQQGLLSPEALIQKMTDLNNRLYIHQQIDYEDAIVEAIPTGYPDLLGALVDLTVAIIKEKVWDPMSDVKERIYSDLSEASNYYHQAQQIARYEITDSQTAHSYVQFCWMAQAYEDIGFSFLDEIHAIWKSKTDRIAEILAKATLESHPNILISTSLLELFIESEEVSKWISDYSNALHEKTSQVFESLSDSHMYQAAPYTLELANSPRITWQVHSPVEVRAYDSQGRVTGIVNGEVRIEIPYSAYHENVVTIFSPTDSYNYELVGTGEGSYELTVTRIIGQEVNRFTTAKVPTSPGATHLLNVDWDALSRERDKLPIRVDSDGDGRFEDIVYLSGPSAKGLPSWVWLVIGVVIGFAIAFGVRRRRPRRKDAKPWVKSFAPTKLRRVVDKVAIFVSRRSKRFLVGVLLIPKGVKAMIARRRQPYIPPAPGAGAPSRKLAPIMAFLSVTIPLTKPDILIGSGAGSDIVIKHPSVADRHARIFQEAGRNVVDDLGSSTGTFVSYSGQPNKETRILAKNALKEGSYIRLGKSAPIIFRAKPRSLVVKYSLRSDKINTIGSDMSNDTVLREPSASRNHAQIVWEAKTFAVKDLGSEHGTFIRYGGESSLERRIRGKNAIKHGSIIRIGNTLLRIEVESMRGIP